MTINHERAIHRMCRLLEPIGYAVLLVGVATLGACTLSEEMQSQRGVSQSKDERDAFVALRAEATTVRLEPGRPVSLVELLESVEGGSIDLQTVRAQVAQASAGVDEARSALRPNFEIRAGLQSKAKAPGNAFFHQDKTVVDLTIDLSIPLDVSGRLAESVRAAQARYRSAEQRLAAAGREQRFLVAQAYFTMLQAQELGDVNRASIAAQSRELADAQARFDAGLLRRNDVLVVEVALTNTRQRGEEIASAVAQSRRALNAAVGLPIDHPTEVVPWQEVIALPTNVIELLDRARYDNPSVDVLVETRQALLHELESNRRANWPELSVGPQLTFTSDSLSQPNTNIAGFLSLNWNPDLSGRIEARSAGLEAQIVESAWAVTATLRQLEQRILDNFRRAVEKQSALAAATTSVGSARENLRILEEQLRAGVATGREVLEGEALVAEQEATLRTSRHQANLAVFQVMNDSGVDPMDFARRFVRD